MEQGTRPFAGKDGASERGTVMFMVITYDINDDVRRLRVAKELENWGQRAHSSPSLNAA